MGQENSQIDPHAPTRTLSARTIEGVANYINDGRPKRIVVMTGAGISTSAGIPDFRSPDTGLYANLARLDLPFAEAVFDISYFREHPGPFYVLAKELYPGKFYPTISHAFVALLDQKFMLLKLFTQNIDCLERQAGVPGSKIVEAHGSFATQRCIDCKTEFPDDLMVQAVESGDVPHCTVPQCNGLVKPDIVFFGEQLPESFHNNKHVPAMADLVIVMGTSLSVQPFASLPQLVGEDTPRILINMEPVGDLGSRADDVLILGDCDEGVRKLADALGWADELEELWSEVNGKNVDDPPITDGPSRTKDEILEAEIEKLTSEVDKALKISKDHTKWVDKGLEKSNGTGPQLISIPALGLGDTGKIKPTDVQLPTSSSPIPVTSESGSKEPPSISAMNEKTAVSTKNLIEEVPSQVYIINKSGTKANLDTTLPHNRPNSESDVKIKSSPPNI
jgi:NAD-dependent histone deacetylase SIR2